MQTELNEKYKDYTLGLAVFDAVPVFIFLLSGLVIYAISGSAAVLAGALIAFAGGMCRVVWKIRVVRRGTDTPALTKAFHILLPLGLGLMVLAAVIAAAGGKGKALTSAVASMPAAVFFLIGLAGACLMGFLGKHLDDSARSNWIEEIVNTVWQTMILAGVVALYFTLCSHAGSTATAALAGSDKVAVTETEEAFIFDGDGRERALVFYPGAKVESAAYAPLMKRIAEAGVDCFLCKVPGNFALFAKGEAGQIRAKYSSENAGYSRWFIGGHSLGGAVSAMIAEEEDWDGLVLLAAYPTGPIDEPTLTVYGTEDHVLNMSKYEKAEGYWPAKTTEVVISGGNHAGFGDYGEQKGDGTAAITQDEQQAITAEAMIAFMEAE